MIKIPFQCGKTHTHTHTPTFISTTALWSSATMCLFLCSFPQLQTPRLGDRQKKNPAPGHSLGKGKQSWLATKQSKLHASDVGAAEQGPCRSLPHRAMARESQGMKDGQE